MSFDTDSIKQDVIEKMPNFAIYCYWSLILPAECINCPPRELNVSLKYNVFFGDPYYRGLFKEMNYILNRPML